MNYWNNITEMYNKQREKGLREYGQTLEDNTALRPVERIVMAQEELIDALVYLEHIKACLPEVELEKHMNKPEKESKKNYYDKPCNECNKSRQDFCFSQDQMGFLGCKRYQDWKNSIK